MRFPARHTCLAILAAVLLGGAGAQAAPTITGKARVLDGKRIEIARQNIRLYGIDVPETDQTCSAGGQRWTCGQHASFALGQLVGRNWVYCFEKYRDAAGEIVAVCHLAGPTGPQLNASMVQHGWALADRQVATDYIPHETAARRAKVGLWQGDFVNPSDWRRGARLSIEERRWPGRCLIKGSIGRTGLRIYHVPGGALYDRVRIDRKQGERWFCSEQEALAAGWRRSLQ